ncbi:STARD3 N-terminal-like protein isoform X1 [Brienomyrus brachyistius]|uniref:STARD3 N-terminal-like protein isoform X1 n=1 Tax=Brienomyrus brachyistius TaxID=42636 RepID=UPI0020B1FEA1|nr:STARD3 N-terminal-like protein isoform X1 [Brienomyrus brachyistius]
MEGALNNSQERRSTLVDFGSINTVPYSTHTDTNEATANRGISDVRRTFCLFVTFDLLFITLLWIIELNANGGIKDQLTKEVIHYDFHTSFFDIFVLAIFRFSVLTLAYALCRLRHWWAVAITTLITSAFLITKVIITELLSQGAFGYLIPITSFILAWIETWFLDFKVLPKEAENNNRLLPAGGVTERTPLIHSGTFSEGQFYSPPESIADSDQAAEEAEGEPVQEKPVN